MPDGSIYSYSNKHSEQFGELYQADSFVLQEFEPKNDQTQGYINSFRKELGLISKRPTTNLKLTRCLSDVFRATQHTQTCLISWPMSTDHYTGGPYSAKLARSVLQALIDSGDLELVQKSSKRDSSTRLYRINKSVAPGWLKFKAHGIGAPVIVRSEKIRAGGSSHGGVRLSRKRFVPEINPLEQQVQRINHANKQYPLTSPDGDEVFRSYRIFNNRSLKHGGRLYGPWQTLPEDNRLEMTIGGKPVAEIDIKASFLSIANAVTGGGVDLGVDPYSDLEFVRSVNDPEVRKKMRDLAKLLVSSYITNGGLLNQFPKGRKKKVVDEATGKTQAVSVKEEYNLGRRAKLSDYLDPILDTFPFLKLVDQVPTNFMFMESEIVISALDEITSEGKPAYPVHDCILCRKEDVSLVVEVLQRKLLSHLGVILDMDISSLDEETYLATKPNIKLDKDQPIFSFNRLNYDVGDQSEVVEDF